MIKAVLFDLDGVLVDMPDVHYEALNRVLALFGAGIGRDEHLAFFNGLPTRKKLEFLENSGRLPSGLNAFINVVKQRYTMEAIPAHCRPDYSKIIMLRQLKQRGYALGCCSNSMRETQHLMLRSALLLDFFDIVLGNDEVEQPKPSPEIYLKAFERLNVAPGECVIVEDAQHGIMAARASGAAVMEVGGVGDVNLSLFRHLLAGPAPEKPADALAEVT